MRGERSKKVPGPVVAGRFPQTEVRACIERKRRLEDQSIKGLDLCIRTAGRRCAIPAYLPSGSMDGSEPRCCDISE